MTERFPGSWTSFDFTLTPQAKDAFENALHGIAGAHYTALAFARQWVPGTHYAFLCEAEYVTGYPNENVVIVRIHQPSEGLAHLISITPVQP